VTDEIFFHKEEIKSNTNTMKNNGEYTMVEKVFVMSGEERCRTVVE